MMRIRMLLSAAALAVSAMFLAVSAQANADTVYTNSAPFAAATSGLTTLGAPSPGYGSDLNVPPASYGPVSLTYNDSLTTVNLNDAAYYTVNGGYPANPDDYLIIFGNMPTDTVTITFPASTAFSVELGGAFGPGEGVNISLSDGFSAPYVLSSYVTSGGPPDFLGFTSTTPLTSVTFDFNDTPDYGTLDQIQYGSAAATPEPGCLILLGTGLLGLGRMARRKMAA